MKLKKETMSKHFIYHIFGKKVGVTSNVVRRMKEQNIKEGEYEIIEEHTNAKTASVRERELQEQHGYRIDNIPYWKTLKNNKKAHTPEANAKRVANTDYSKIDYKSRTEKIDYKAVSAKRTANTDYSKIDYKALQEKRLQKIDFSTIYANRNEKDRVEKWVKKVQKPISQFDLQDNFIKNWDSATIAAKELNLQFTGISMCCRGKLNKCGGYKWKFTN